MTETSIVRALLAHLATLSHESPPLEIAWPGVDFTPVPQVTYLEAKLLPNETVNLHVENDGDQLHQGFLQVDVVHPTGAGALGATAHADAVVQHFAKGTRIQGEGVLVEIIRQPWIAPLLEEQDRLRVPVSIPYQSVN